MNATIDEQCALVVGQLELENPTMWAIMRHTARRTDSCVADVFVVDEWGDIRSLRPLAEAAGLTVDGRFHGVRVYAEGGVDVGTVLRRRILARVLHSVPVDPETLDKMRLRWL